MTGAEIQDLRTAAGVSAAEVARELKYHQSAISRLERRQQVRPETVARYLGAIALIAGRRKRNRQVIARRLEVLRLELLGASL